MAELTPLERIILIRYDIMTRVAFAINMKEIPGDDELAEIIIRDHPKTDYINKETLMSTIKKLRKTNILEQEAKDV